MKKLAFGVLSLGLMISAAGCQAIHDSFRAVEDVVKAPPQALIDALKLAGDFVMGLLGMFLNGVFSGVLGGVMKNLGI